MTRVVRVCVLLFAAVSLLGCQNNQQKAQEADERIQRAVSQEKQVWLDKLEKKYENPEAHYELGALYLEDGLYERAEFHFNTALGFDPMYPKAQAGLVKSMMLSGQKDKGALAAELYLKQAEQSAEASALLGKAFQKQDLPDYAIQAYRAALRMAPTSPAINRQIGYYYLAQGDTVRAEQFLRTSFHLDPYQSDVAAALGKMGIVIEIPRNAAKDTKRVDEALAEEK